MPSKRVVDSKYQNQKKRKESNTIFKQFARKEKSCRNKEQQKNSLDHKKARQDDEYRKNEQKRDTLSRKFARQDAEYRSKEQEKDSLAHSVSRNTSSWEEQVQKFNTEIHCCLDYICGSCGGLWYRRCVVKTTREKVEDLVGSEFSNELEVNGEYHFCHTCNDDIKKGNIPKICLTNGLHFPKIPPLLKILTGLEERLVSPRLPFMTIRPLGYSGQHGLKGGIINVPNNLDVIARALPRPVNESATVQVKLLRRMRQKGYDKFETIRPYVVYQAANYLINTEIYKEENIILSSTWLKNMPGEIVPFIVNLEDKDESTNVNTSVPLEEEEDEPSDVPLNETLLHKEDCAIVRIAPGEGQPILSLLKDLNVKELSFPTIYGGVKRQLTNKAISYCDIARSELRRYDRRCSRADKIFFSFIRVQTDKIAKNISLAIRKKKKRGKVTAGELLSQETVDNLVQQDDGYRILRNLSNSPAYMEQKKKDLMAMIRQLGLATFFITISAAETKWPELLQMLEKRSSGKTITEYKAMEMEDKRKADLIRDDPILCALSFDNRERALEKFILHPKNGIFSPYEHQDSFKRREVAHRGSLHSHRLQWIKGAPKYDDNDPTSTENCVIFIDEFISCKRNVGEPLQEYVAYQLHKHSHTCRRGKSGKCRFGYPIPPMQRTMILKPLPESFDTIHKKYLQRQFKDLQCTLEKRGRAFNEDECFQDFTDQNAFCTEENYLLCIRSTLKRSKVFLRRKTNEVFINSYNPKLVGVWKANIDVQFVLDSFACASYCVNYISKSDRGVSKALRDIDKEIRAGNQSLKNRLRAYANEFSNKSEVSAQEAACMLMRISMTECSRDTVYINTGLPEERVILVKFKEELEAMDPESTDIAANNLLDRYSVRPLQMENVCLADFAAKYTFIKTEGSKRKKKPIENVEYTLLDNSGFLAKRTFPKVIRYRRYGLQQDSFNFYREQVMLYMPWRKEKEDILDKNSEALYQLHKETIAQNRTTYDPKLSDDEINIQFSAANFEYETENQIESIVASKEFDFLHDPSIVQDIGVELGQSESRFDQIMPPRFKSKEDYQVLVRSLNATQRTLFMDTLTLLKCNTGPFFRLFHGQAGVGKSKLIEAIIQVALRMRMKELGACGDDIPVFVAAFTGKAAFNVEGMTLHCAFRLMPLQSADDVHVMDYGSRNSLQAKYSALKLVILDEVSMISLKMFKNIDKRLRQIFQSKVPFGGISVIVVGDFWQLSPMMGQFVFATPNGLGGALTGNLLWEPFRMIELTEVMRQKDDKVFAEALGRMSRGLMTPEDILLFQAREIHRLKTPPSEDASHLFYANDDCEKHNKKVLNAKQGQEYVSVAFDRVQGSGRQEAINNLYDKAPNLTLQQTSGMPHSVRLKVGVVYMVTTNIDVSDGLFNGATGTLKEILTGSLTNGSTAVRMVYLEFPKESIGRNARQLHRQFSRRQKYPDNWTPIDSIARPIDRYGNNEGLQLIRRQIPLVPSNAFTIHKAQGSSLDQVVVHITDKGLSRPLLYVGCSRATKLENLFIDGTFQPPPRVAENHQVYVELNRLRGLGYPFKIPVNFVSLGDSFAKLIFHNVQSLESHWEDVIVDKMYTSADAMGFVEPKCKPGTNFKLDTHFIIQRENPPNGSCSYGSVVFQNKTSKGDPTFQSHADKDNHWQFTTWFLDEVKIIMVYRSPKGKLKKFIDSINQVLSVCKTKTIVVGDFNLDFLSESSLTLQKVFGHHNFQLVTPCESSTDGNSMLDACFSNFLGVTAEFYESYFSFHKPICVWWSKTFTPVSDSEGIPDSAMETDKEMLDSAMEVEEEEFVAPQMIETSRFGIPNIGNTCYLNSLVHGLCSLFGTNQLMLLGPNPVQTAMRTFVGATIHSVEESFLREAKSRLDVYLPDFSNYNQEDPADFFIAVLPFLSEKNFILEDLQITCQSTMTCYCNNREGIISNEVLLSVGLPHTSLQECIYQWFYEELDFHCSDCGFEGLSTRRTVCIVSPRYLIFQLKRFKTQQNGQISKLYNYIDVGERLQIPQQEGLVEYEVKSIIGHIGNSLNSGHYVNTEKTKDGWTCYNDDIVTQNTNINGDSYLIFCAKI